MVVLWDWDISEIGKTLLRGTAGSEHLPYVMLCARHWGSRMSQAQTSILEVMGSPCRDLPDVCRSLGTSPADLGSHLCGVWNVVFWL